MTLKDISKTFVEKTSLEIYIPGRDGAFCVFVRDMDLLSEELLDREVDEVGGDQNGFWAQLK
jgi:hypothetical protein